MSRNDVIEQISIFQRKLEKYANSGETDKVLFYIHKLKYLPITVRHLEATGVGRTVNSLRHHGGMVGSKARDLVGKWKKMVSAEESEGEAEEEEEEEEEEEVDIERRTDGDSGVALRDQNGDDMEDEEDEEDDDRLQIEENGSEKNAPVPDYRPSGSNSYEYGDDSPGGEDNSYNPVTSQRDYQLNTNAPSADYHPSSLGVNNSHCSSPDEATSGWEDESPAAPPDRRNESSSSSSKSLSKKSSKEDKHKKKDKHRDKDKSKNSSGSVEKEKKKEHKHKAKHKEKDKDREEKKSKSKSKHKEKERHEGKPKEKKHEENGERKSDKEKKKHILNGYGPLSDDADSSSRSLSAKYEAEAERRDVDDKLREKSSSSSSHRKVERSREKNNKESSQERESSESELEVKDNKIKDSVKDKEKNKHHSKHSSSSSSSSSSKKDKSKQDLKNHDNQREDESKKKKSKHRKDDDNDFGAALMGFDSPSKKKKKKKKKDRKERESSDDEQQPSSSKSRKRPLSDDDEDLPDIKKPKLLETSPQKLPKLPPSMGSSSLEFPLLPEINPNYKPLPRVPLKSDPNLMSDTKTEDDVFKIMLQQKGKRSKMYSGRVTGLTHVPSLFDISMRTATENIDSLNLRIGQHLAFDIIKPILERATPPQLLHIEDTVPHLLEDTDLIWENHCKKDFRNKTLEDMETWREMWLRCSDERDRKLKSLTANWQQKCLAKAEPKRQTKLAFVNDTVKVPKSVARAQAKFGTAVPSTSAAKPSKAAEVLARKTAMQNAQRAEKAAAPRPTAAKNKKVAPLMAKTRQFYKKAFRR